MTRDQFEHVVRASAAITGEETREAAANPRSD